MLFCSGTKGVKLNKTDLDSIQEIVRGIPAGDRRFLARGITLLESDLADHRQSAVQLLRSLLPRTGGSVRVGISGAPGVGKSTFIEAFGNHLISSGRSVAVLAVDPSSRQSGGSVLGDKTRMERLANHPQAFVRPSPAGRTLGGVARRTRESILLCEAAGFDVVLVETVGVGQSETAVSEMVDIFLLLISPGGGDELQGIKRGIAELADLVVVNKMDGEFQHAAERMASDYRAALSLLRSRRHYWQPEVITCSALEETGLKQVWAAISRYQGAVADAGGVASLRSIQAKDWLWDEINQRLLRAITDDASIASLVADFEEEVKAGRELPVVAAERVLSKFLGNNGKNIG